MDNKILKKRTLAVIVITLITMAAEIYYGITSHSMALTADGFHMGTHAIALFITLAVCLLAINFQGKEEKFNALGGYTSAILLGFTSLAIIWESVERFIRPLTISFTDAITVAIIGLVVNLLCVFVMGDLHHHHHHHGCHHHHEEGENLNYKAAYLHILADAFTSVLAIAALLLGKYFGFAFLDPCIGILGGIIIAKWAIDLIKSSSLVLLDFEAS
ncbi:MAG: cation diffusion facilitator family transporter [Muribaculaceae bacterium]|nr:cation diffusion facilitator family transporter [Muribaculaceae bacterium]